MNLRGNKWFKCDLHIHTSESECFEDDNRSAEDWVQECLDKKLDVVAVTDHNSGNNIDRIKEAAENTNLTVFPGVEITCDSSKVHMLIIFDKDKTSQDVNDFLNYCGIESKDFAKADAHAFQQNLMDVVYKANERGAIIIPAHIDEYSSIASISHKAMEEFLELPYINAVQVVNKEFYDKEMNPDKQYDFEEITQNIIERYSGVNQYLVESWHKPVKMAVEKNKAIVTFSDNPLSEGDSKHGLWGIGRRHTWIKMDETKSFESLRQALLIPNQRIRNDFDFEKLPYKTPDMLIEGIKINNTLLNLNSELKVQFNPQLNTIIGGRGTGKSTINRILRGILNKEEELVLFKELYTEQKSFFRKSTTEGQGILNENTVIELYIQRFGKSYKIIFKDLKNDKFSSIEEFELDDSGNFIPSETKVLDLFQIDIYSQKQIYELAKNPNALKNIIDQSISSIEQNSDELTRKEEDYKNLKAEIRSLENNISKKERILTERDDIKERILRFEQGDYRTVFDSYKKATNDEKALNKTLDIYKEKTAKLENLLNEFSLSENINQEFSEESREELTMLIDENNSVFETIFGRLENIKQELNRLVISLENKIENSNWNKLFENVKIEKKDLEESLSAQDLVDFQNMEKLHRELDEKNIELESINNDIEKLEILKDKLSDNLEEYQELRENRTTLRSEFLNDVMSDENDVKIEVNPYKDYLSFEKMLRKIIQRSEGFVEDLKEVQNFVIRGDSLQNTDELKKLFYNIRDNNHESKFTKRFVNVIKGLNTEQMSMIDLLYPEDDIIVKYRPTGSNRFKSISNASAGQKTSAILTFLLSYGEIPLILDQPEDDLDNKLINDLIVERLSKSKNNRQIIAVTHNANIPVNGDAEWIIAMDSNSRNIGIANEGTLEDEKVKKDICDVMEGGVRAFDLRRKRYNL